MIIDADGAVILWLLTNFVWVISMTTYALLKNEGVEIDSSTNNRWILLHARCGWTQCALHLVPDYQVCLVCHGMRYFYHLPCHMLVHLLHYHLGDHLYLLPLFGCKQLLSLSFLPLFPMWLQFLRMRTILLLS